MGHGELLGIQHNPREIAHFCYLAGWKDVFILTISVMICLSESQGFDRAIHYNDNGSFDRGMWQINSNAHPHVTETMAYDPKRATELAFEIYKDRNYTFNAWNAYTSKVYLHDTYVMRACRGVGNFLGEHFKNQAITKGLDSQLKIPLLDYGTK